MPEILKKSSKAGIDLQQFHIFNLQFQILFRKIPQFAKFTVLKKLQKNTNYPNYAGWYFSDSTAFEIFPSAPSGHFFCVTR